MKTANQSSPLFGDIMRIVAIFATCALLQYINTGYFIVPGY